MRLYFTKTINPPKIWIKAITQCHLNESERFYFSDHVLFSNDMFEKLEKNRKNNFLHSLSIYTMSQILKFLDYQTIMTQIRYLNKSFFSLTQESIQYIED
jgi:tetraacyldisaccharide-1-P 4'-kinase